jgi:phosphotriesterase-related protein
VEPERITGVLSHEHLLALTPGPWMTGGGDPVEARVALAVSALGGLAEYGLNAVVDLSPYGDAGRDERGTNVTLLQEISRRSGVHVVAGTATYRAAFSPSWVLEADIDSLTRRFVADAREGIGGTTVRAGILGEQPTGLGEVTPHEEKGLRAAARAHLETGLAINTHTTHGTMALEQVDILLQEGADPSRVVIGHLDNGPGIDSVRRVLDRGVNIAFDSVGKQFWDVRMPPGRTPPPGEYTKQAVHRADLARAEMLAALVAEGYAGQILLSQDMVGSQVYLNPSTYGQWGYCYLPAVFRGLVAEHGVSEKHLDTMLRVNPVRLLSRQ